MSGAPVKRSHEEGSHSSSLKFHPHEDTGSYPKLTSGVSNEFHLPYEMGPDARVEDHLCIRCIESHHLQMNHTWILI